MTRALCCCVPPPPSSLNTALLAPTPTALRAAQVLPPQTFYRWYKDKIDIFVQVHQVWEDAETAILGELMARQATSLQIAEALAEGQRSFLIFRRHLRQLAYDHPEIKQARADSRKRHIAALREWQPRLTADDATLAAILLQLERLCDAIAEGELADMGLSDHGALCEGPTHRPFAYGALIMAVSVFDLFKIGIGPPALTRSAPCGQPNSSSCDWSPKASCPGATTAL